MTMKLPLEVRDGIQVKAKAPSREVYFDSRVEEITAGELLISWPVKGTSRMPLREQQVILVSFTREQRIYEFDASVLDVITDPAPLVQIQVAGQLRSVQRRDDYRAPVAVSVDLAPRVVGLAGYKESRRRVNHIVSQTVDLSAGGLGIHHATPIAIGTIFEIRLDLSNESKQPLQMTGRVVRCEPVIVSPELESVLYDIGFVFSRISETARQRIVKFVFAAQLAERRQE
jgi:c-di-GMP-binding flagellar brake protein YcgR